MKAEAQRAKQQGRGPDGKPSLPLPPPISSISCDYFTDRSRRMKRKQMWVEADGDGGNGRGAFCSAMKFGVKNVSLPKNGPAQEPVNLNSFGVE